MLDEQQSIRIPQIQLQHTQYTFRTRAESTKIRIIYCSFTVFTSEKLYEYRISSRAKCTLINGIDRWMGHKNACKAHYTESAEAAVNSERQLTFSSILLEVNFVDSHFYSWALLRLSLSKDHAERVNKKETSISTISESSFNRRTI